MTGLLSLCSYAVNFMINGSFLKTHVLPERPHIDKETGIFPRKPFFWKIFNKDNE